MRLTQDFVEFIECCVRREVSFLVVGGYAVAAHGQVVVQLGYAPLRIDLLTSIAGVTFGEC